MRSRRRIKKEGATIKEVTIKEATIKGATIKLNIQLIHES